MSGLVLSLFDRSGNMVRPWAEAGFDCVTVDLQHEPGWHHDGEIWRVGMDVLAYDATFTKRPAIVFGFPPCTDLAISGARWFQEKGMGKLIEALTLVERCRQICEDEIGAPFMIENPVSTLSTYWRKPDYSFDPCEFGGYPGGEGDAYTKRTCLWTGHGFRMPPRRPIPPVDGSRMHRVSPGPERANKRSETPKGFARAVFEANQPGAVVDEWVPAEDSLFGGAA